MPNGPRRIRNRVRLGLFPNLLLFLLILRQDRNQIIRDGLLKLQWKVRSVRVQPSQESNDVEPTLKV